jgi:hypothetical protein
MPIKLTQEQFINKANIKHNNYYDYSLVSYINANTKVKIICPKHGEFEQQPSNHLFGQRCIKCMGDNVRKARISNTEDFIIKSIKIHGNKYDYSLVNYKTGKDKVIIICSKHGEFLQTPFAHSSPSMKQGCPYCNVSKGEDEVEKYLIKNSIEYKCQYSFLDCINPKTSKKLPFDFYLPECNILIEYQGEQHYKKTGYFEKKAGGLKGLQYRDSIKKQYCQNKNIKFIEISYKDFNNIQQILKEKI